MKQFTRNAFVIMTLWVSLTMFLQLRPIDDHDIFTWIQLGQIILNKHTLVVKEPFSYLIEGQLIPTERWLSYIIWAILYRLGSWPLIKLVHDFIFTGAFILAGSVAVLLSKRTHIRVRLFCLCLAIVMGFLVAATNSSVRSQGFAILCFSLLFYACQSNWPLKKQLLIIVPVLLLWQNIHPSLIMGIILLCVMFLKRFTNNVQTVKQFKTLSIITGIAVMLYFATPDGFQLIEITQTHTMIARSILGISEWMPPWDASVRNAMVMFWLAVVITIIMIVKSPKRIAVSDLIGTVIFCGASFYMSRLSLFWAVFMVPTWAFLLTICSN